jgi:exonuclease III
MGDLLQYASWNVAGLCNPYRKYKVLNWVKSLPFSLTVLAIQELKTDDFRLDNALRTILLRYQFLSSPPNEGKGGTALLIHPLTKILHSGTLDEGRAVWAIVEHAESTFGCASIYAPNSPRQRSILWEELKNLLPAANWILSGDYNMTESVSDSTGLSPLLQGSELEAWRLFKMRFNLKDARMVASQVEGAHYTWRRTQNGRITQSRID